MMRKITLLLICCLLISLAACNAPLRTPTPSPTLAPTATPTETPTPIPPSPTPIPLAARVNGEELTLEEYQAEMARYQAAYGTNLASDWQKLVLDDLINQILLAQAASQNGYTASDADLQARVDNLVQQVGGAKALSDWMTAHGYSEQAFHLSLARSIAAAWMSDQITSSVPWVADQAHARQILLYNSTDANDILTRLNEGADFDTLAFQYDPATGGDLGWFPKGYLTEPALEAAAFALEPGKYSDVIQTSLGYHILLLIERDPQHPLTSDARMQMQEEALANWLVERRGQSDIQILAH
jgi:parvulin-like peptidyl-prolyl isomerase